MWNRTSEDLGKRAIVVGASMAGLCAARVLSERFDEVVVLDRDDLGGAQPRQRVPQGRHPHLLLTAGARLLEGWFPGLIDELKAGGAVDVDLCRDFLWYQSGGVQRRPASALRAPAMSRPFLESTVRRRVAGLPNVSIRESVTVIGLVADGPCERIVGVRCADGTSMDCALVVDATGRGARSLGWLAELGYEPPTTSLVGVDTTYVSRRYRRTPSPARDWKAAAVIGDPETKRLTMVLPLEGDQWILMLGGVNGEAAPTDDAGMLAYASSFASPVVADVMRDSEPLGPAVTHRFPANQRRHVERMRRLPLGWALLGDAVCSFDPIYGQGMTSAAQQAHALARSLDRAGSLGRSFTRSYVRAAAKVVNVPWSIAVGGDFVYDGTTGTKPAGTDLLNRYMDQVMLAGQRDDKVVIRFNEVVSLVRGPESLLSPAFVLRVLAKSRRMRGDLSVMRDGTAEAAGADL